MSGHGLAEDAARTLADGFAAHLVKPVELDGLLALLAPLVVPAGVEH